MLAAETVTAQTQPTRRKPSSRAKRPRITALDQHRAPVAKVERIMVRMATTRTGCPKKGSGSVEAAGLVVEFIARR